MFNYKNFKVHSPNYTVFVKTTVVVIYLLMASTHIKSGQNFTAIVALTTVLLNAPRA